MKEETNKIAIGFAAMNGEDRTVIADGDGNLIVVAKNKALTLSMADYISRVVPIYFDDMMQGLAEGIGYALDQYALERFNKRVEDAPRAVYDLLYVVRAAGDDLTVLKLSEQQQVDIRNMLDAGRLHLLAATRGKNSICQTVVGYYGHVEGDSGGRGLFIKLKGKEFVVIFSSEKSFKEFTAKHLTYAGIPSASMTMADCVASMLYGNLIYVMEKGAHNKVVSLMPKFTVETGIELPKLQMLGDDKEERWHILGLGNLDAQDAAYRVSEIKKATGISAIVNTIPNSQRN